MTDQGKLSEFEQQLAQLKQSLTNDEIALDEYTERARELRFDDEDKAQTWWLDAESETWYVAPLGTENFEVYDLPEELQNELDEVGSTPPVSEADSEVDTDLETKVNEEVESIPVSNEAELSDGKPVEVPPSIEEQSSSTSPPTDKEKSGWSRGILIGTTVVVVLALILCAGGVGFFLGDDNVTPTAVIAQTSLTPQLKPAHTPTEIPSPLPTATPTMTLPSLPVDTDTPTASPTPTFTSIPVDTETPTTAAPTDTPEPLPEPNTNTPTHTPEPELTGKIAYPEFDNTTGTFNIKVMDLSTGAVITPALQASQPALSPDGTKLAYISWAPDEAGLYSISLDNDVRNIISQSREGQRPQWNFDNKASVFEYIKEEQEDVRFSDSDGVPNIQKGLTPTWMPDGRLVLRVCQNATCGLAIVNTNGTELIFLTNSTADFSPAVSPDGRQIAYSSKQDGNWDVWVMGIADKKPKRLTLSPSREGIPTWSPDGNWIAFASENGDGKWHIHIIRPDGTGRQELPIEISGNLDARILEEEYRQLGWLHESISWSN